MTTASDARECREPGCTTRIILVRRDGGRWVPVEADDQHGDLRAGCLIVVDGTAWRLRDLVEHFMARFQISEPKAIDLAADYPAHRPHVHRDWAATP